MTKTTKPPRRSKAHREPHTMSATASAPDPIDAANLDQAFVAALKTDFIIHGKEAIEAMRSEKPVDYVKIVAALRTKDAGDKIDPLSEMSDEELDRRIEELAAQAGYEIRRVASPGRDEAGG